jgi:hypothetical protein
MLGIHIFLALGDSRPFETLVISTGSRAVRRGIDRCARDGGIRVR